MGNIPIVPLDPKSTLHKDTVTTPWGEVATEPGASYLEPFHQPTPFRCPKCNELMEPGFFAEGRCPRCRYTWRAKDAIDMLIESEVMKISNGGWGKAQLDALEDKRRVQESIIMTRGGDIQEMTQAKRALSEWFNRERRRVFAEFNRRAEHNAVTQNIRSQAINARL